MTIDRVIHPLRAIADWIDRTCETRPAPLPVKISRDADSQMTDRERLNAAQALIYRY